MRITRATITAKGIVGMSQSGWNRVLRKAITKVGQHWKRWYLPFHFKKAAFNRYARAYRPRKGDPGSGRRWKGSYSWRKMNRYTSGEGKRAIGEVKPLVWSGESRASALSAWSFTARKKRSAGVMEVTVHLYARALNRVRPGNDSEVDANVELHAMTAAEERDLSQVYGKSVDEQLARLGKTRG